MIGLEAYIDNAVIDDCEYEVCEIHKNVTVTVNRCMKCGRIEIDWERQDNTEDIMIKPLEEIDYGAHQN